MSDLQEAEGVHQAVEAEGHSEEPGQDSLGGGLHAPRERGPLRRISRNGSVFLVISKNIKFDIKLPKLREEIMSLQPIDGHGNFKLCH